MITMQYHENGYQLTIADAGNQVFFTASADDPEGMTVSKFQVLYRRMIHQVLSDGLSVFHERIFASPDLYTTIREVRNAVFSKQDMENTPFCCVGGKAGCEGISGVQLHAVRVKEGERVETVYSGSHPVGRKWSGNDADYYLFHAVHSRQVSATNYEQTVTMFRQTEDLLQAFGLSFRHVARTWIYLDDILAQYDDFNAARNVEFRRMGLLDQDMNIDDAEQVWMPASTGIGCTNPFGASGVMDVLAVYRKNPGAVVLYNETGKQQNSAFRYGSAFSRAIVAGDQNGKTLYLSGTASIDERGLSVYDGDVDKQIEKTFEVVEALIGKEGFALADMCEATAFLKNRSDVPNFIRYCNKMKLSLPNVLVIADVCRDELLFEIDAVFCKPEQ